jgi:hypothetical protein
MKGMLECYIQEKPFGKENLQILVFFLFDAGTVNCVTEGYNSFLFNFIRNVFHMIRGK